MSPSLTSTKRPMLPYVALGALFVITAAYQALDIVFVGEKLAGRAGAITRPFGIPFYSPTITSVEEEAQRAGIRPDDTLIAVNGHPYQGEAVLNRALNYARPGDLLTVTVRHKTGKEETAPIRLAYHLSPEDAWYVTVAVGLVLPLACVLLGFWVAAVRPHDPTAWLL